MWIEIIARKYLCAKIENENGVLSHEKTPLRKKNIDSRRVEKRLCGNHSKNLKRI